MNTKEEVLKIGKKLEKLIADNAADHASICDLLKTLQSFKVTLDILEKTRIGVIVNNVRKAAKADEIISLSKSLIKGWKKLVPDDKGQGDTPARRHSSASTTSSEGAVSPHHHHRRLSSLSEVDKRPHPPRRQSSVSEDSNSAGGDTKAPLVDAADVDRRASTSSEGSAVLSRSVSEQDDRGGVELSPPRNSSPVHVDDTSDPVRIKCREMLTAALAAPAAVDGGQHCETLAAEIEHFVYRQFDNTDMKYKNRIRSLVTNLKDVKNPRLHENVFLGHISSKRFSMMTPEEMASEEMKKLRRKLSEEAFNDHQMAVNSGTKSDLFQCGKCGKRNTMYNQLQTRSSDEPMTTFVLCNECGNRWKFC